MYESIETSVSPVQPYISDLPLYVPGRSPEAIARDFKISRVIQLASNENPFGHSPAVGDAVRSLFSKESSGLSRYPDSEAVSIREALARFYAVPLESISVTNGSHELVDLCAAISLSPLSSGIFSQYAFQAYPISIRERGAHAIQVRAKDFAHDLDGMAAAVGHGAKLIYLCNPNNPTGTILDISSIDFFLRKIPVDVLVVLDEAYIEFADSKYRRASIALLSDFPNLVIARTFSKAYGLAAARVGYGIMNPHIARSIARVRPTFSVGKIAQVSALAALRDQQFLDDTVRKNQLGRKQLMDAFSDDGLDFVVSHANFVMVRVPDAPAVVQSLLEKGIIVRPLNAYDLPDYIRVTVGRSDENEIFLDALRAAIGKL